MNIKIKNHKILIKAYQMNSLNKFMMIMELKYQMTYNKQITKLNIKQISTNSVKLR